MVDKAKLEALILKRIAEEGTKTVNFKNTIQCERIQYDIDCLSSILTAIRRGELDATLESYESERQYGYNQGYYDAMCKYGK